MSKHSEKCYRDKICERCESELSHVHYSKRYCVECSKQLHSERGRRHRLSGDYKERSRAFHLMRQYKMSLNDEKELLARQNGSCAICTTPLILGEQKVHIDHNHKTGHVRGLLCQKCNLGLGLFNDNPLLLLRAVMYLEITDFEPTNTRIPESL